MICPQSQEECECTSVLCCVRSTRDPSIPWHQPSLVEIERLVDALIRVEDEQALKDRAALMAAIERMVK